MADLVDNSDGEVEDIDDPLLILSGSLPIWAEWLDARSATALLSVCRDWRETASFAGAANAGISDDDDCVDEDKDYIECAKDAVLERRKWNL